jgi:hypothetical protein
LLHLLSGKRLKRSFENVKSFVHLRVGCDQWNQ